MASKTEDMIGKIRAEKPSTRIFNDTIAKSKSTDNVRKAKILKRWDEKVASDPEMDKLHAALKKKDGTLDTAAARKWYDRYNDHKNAAKIEIELEDEMEKNEKGE